MMAYVARTVNRDIRKSLIIGISSYQHQQRFLILMGEKVKERETSCETNFGDDFFRWN